MKPDASLTHRVRRRVPVVDDRAVRRRRVSEVVPALPAWADVAIVIVPHVPAGCTERFARRLRDPSRLTVQEAEHGMPQRGGAMYIAPGGVRYAVTGALSAPCFALALDRPLAVVRPAAVRDSGGLGIVRDRASGRVGGMPEAARRPAGADVVAPRSAIAGALGAAVERLREPRAA
jgi:chemotaxis response regulator CheB